jgi:hypothetical protein
MASSTPGSPQVESAVQGPVPMPAMASQLLTRGKHTETLDPPIWVTAVTVENGASLQPAAPGNGRHTKRALRGSRTQLRVLPHCASAEQASHSPAGLRLVH